MVQKRNEIIDTEIIKNTGTNRINLKYNKSQKIYL